MKWNREEHHDDADAGDDDADDDDQQGDDKSGGKAPFVRTTMACVGLSTQRGPATTLSQSRTIFVTTYDNTQINNLTFNFIQHLITFIWHTIISAGQEEPPFNLKPFV